MTEARSRNLIDDRTLNEFLTAYRYFEDRNGERFVIDPDTPQVVVWNSPTIVAVWSKEDEGEMSRVRKAVKESLEHSHFYSGLPDSGYLLDVGVGAQSYLDSSLLPKDATLYAADLSKGMLESLKRKETPLYHRFIETTATDLPIENDLFDRTLTTFMMRYLSRDDQLKAVGEFVRTAKPESEVHVIDFNFVHYPYQVSTFNPNVLENGIYSPAFQNKLGIMGKNVTSVTTEELKPHEHLGSVHSRLYHMTLQLGK